jgi:serine/threonine protein kinase
VQVGTTATADMRVVTDGARLGKYQLLRRIATGGMAELFLARAVAMAGFEKLVVLKRILPQHAESDEFIKMFLTEARLAATLHHPNIVQVYDIGEEAGHYFFTMEWVQGQDLRRIVRAARKAEVALPLEHVLHIIAGVAAGLDHAHDKADTDGTPLGIVHRDVSPSNVLVTYDGAVKLVDFGIAKAAAFQSNTIAGTLKGNVPYMSPEQCRGEVVDRRSDIFSIGTLLWEMTTGARLFAGDNEIAIINRVAKADVPLPTSIRPDYPPQFETIVMRALHSDPEQRYQHAIDLQIDLEDFSREHRLPVSSARMGKFMRELFADEIQATAAQLHADRSDVSLSGSSAALPAVLPPTPGLAGPTAQTVIDSADAREIPSEVLGRSATPRVDSNVSRSTVTQSDVGDVDEPPRRRATPWAAIAAGVGLTVGGMAAWMNARPTADVPVAAPSVVIRADTPLDPDERPAPPPVEAPPVEAPPVEAPVAAPVAAPPVAAQAPIEDDIELLPEPAATASSPEAPSPKSTPRPSSTSSPQPKTSPKRPAAEKKPEPKKPTSPEPAKKTWDPDAAMPPE